MARYIVSDEFRIISFDNLDKVIDYIVRNFSDETIVNLINDVGRPTHIGSVTYSTETTLYKVDRFTSFEVNSEFFDNFLMDMRHAIEEQGEKLVYCLGYKIQVFED